MYKNTTEFLKIKFALKYRWCTIKVGYVEAFALRSKIFFSPTPLFLSC